MFSAYIQRACSLYPILNISYVEYYFIVAILKLSKCRRVIRRYECDVYICNLEFITHNEIELVIFFIAIGSIVLTIPLI